MSMRLNWTRQQRKQKQIERNKMRQIKIEVLFEDLEIVVCRKPAGIATQSARCGQQDMVSLLKNARSAKGEEPYVGLLHRLDQPVEGVMVFAKTKQAAAALSRQVASRGIDKCYLAVVQGKLAEDAGNLEHYLMRDGKTNLSRVASQGEPEAKLARLSYQVLAYDKARDASLVRIKLDTGRHHQIRVQMSAIGHPLLGDQKYHAAAGSGEAAMNRQTPPGRLGREMVALCSHKIGFVHPVTKKQMEYAILPQNPLFQGFDMTSTLDN